MKNNFVVQPNGKFLKKHNLSKELHFALCVPIQGLWDFANLTPSQSIIVSSGKVQIYYVIFRTESPNQNF